MPKLFHSDLKFLRISKGFPRYSLLSIPRISGDWAKFVELSVVRGNPGDKNSTRPLVITSEN